MPRKLLKYQGTVNRFTYSLRYNWSIHSGYSDNVEGWVPPATGSSRNTTLSFGARSPFIATVDWGDGQVEQFFSQKNDNFTGGNYRVVFRAFMTNVADNATQLFAYQTVPPHHYADDDKNALRTVTISFTEDITYVFNDYNSLESFPIMELPFLEILQVFTPTRNVGSMPFDVFSNIPNLTQLNLSGVVVDNTVIPESLWTMEKLKVLAITACFNSLKDVDSSGLRNVNKLVNLEKLDISQLPTSSIYFKELNDLPKLNILTMAPGSGSIGANDPDIGIDKFPIMDEVDHINTNMTRFAYIDDYRTGYKRKAWPYHLSGYGWENLTEINMYCASNVVLDPFPDYWYEHRSASQFTIREALGNQERADEFVSLFYDFVVNWEQSTMSQTAKDGKRNQWYGMTISYRVATSNSPNTVPSGLYRPTEGFELGVSNGNPQTAMEKVYVLEKNYKQKWNSFEKPTS